MSLHLLPLHERELIMRAFWATLLAIAGLAMLLRPNVCLWLTGVGDFCAPDNLSPDLASRLQRTLEARRQAEATPQAWKRWLGVLALVAAAAQLVPEVPYAVPYAVLCLGIAGSRLLSYSAIRRATQRRVAPLVPRSPLDAFQPFLVAGVAGAMASIVIMAWVTPLLPAVIVVAIATATLIWVAWQIAAGRALLVGDDPEMAYAVDRRVRERRVMNLALLATLPAFVLIAPSSPLVPEAYRGFTDAAFWITATAFFATLIAIYICSRRSTAEFERSIA
ncbi:MAG TPA: hypothetical protein VGK84_05530 [Candidatus Tumulicola sp.]|jgi:hypothetical protein